MQSPPSCACQNWAPSIMAALPLSNVPRFFWPGQIAKLPPKATKVAITGTRYQGSA